MLTASLHSPRRAASTSVRFLVSSIAAVSLLLGCAGSGHPNVSTLPYDGPPITVENSSGQHVVVMTAPTGGWMFNFDRTEAAFGHTNVFITANRPDPAVMQTQAQVRHEVGSAVPTTSAIEVYARVLGHSEKPGGQEYSLVLSAPAIPGAPAKTR